MPKYFIPVFTEFGHSKYGFQSALKNSMVQSIKELRNIVADYDAWSTLDSKPISASRKVVVCLPKFTIYHDAFRYVRSDIFFFKKLT